MLKKLVYPILLFFLLAGCRAQSAPEPLPAPESPCPVQLEWRGLQPGTSTQLDAILALGLPDWIARKTYGEKRVTEYIYRNGEGPASKVLQTRILFSREGTVDWIEIAAPESDIPYRSIKDIYDALGALDTIYDNNNYNPAWGFFDVLGGPAQVYVWSGCGVAAVGMPYYSMDEAMILHPIPDKAREDKPGMEVLYEPPFNAGGDSERTSQSAVLVEALFIPTSYEGFKEDYLYQFPYFDSTLLDQIEGNQ